MRPVLRAVSVDDWQHRHDKIRNLLRRAGLNFELRERSGPAAVQEQDLSWASVVFLDHDMCQRPKTMSDGGLEVAGDCPSPRPGGGGDNMLDEHCGCLTGMDLVRRMVAGTDRPVAVVHTMNGAAGDRMMAHLTRAGFRAHRATASLLHRKTPREWAREWGLVS